MMVRLLVRHKESSGMSLHNLTTPISGTEQYQLPRRLSTNKAVANILT